MVVSGDLMDATCEHTLNFPAIFTGSLGPLLFALLCFEVKQAGVRRYGQMPDRTSNGGS